MSPSKRRLNNEELTIEKLREFKGFEFVNESEAEQIVDTIKSLSVIIYQNFDSVLKRNKQLINP